MRDGTLTSGRIDVAGDADWFQFVAQAGKQYIVRTSDLSIQCDTVLQVYGPDGQTLIGVDDDSGGSLASRIAWRAASSGIYYLRVSHYDPLGTGSYKISVEEANIVCTPLQAGQLTQGSLSQGGESKLYCLNVQGGDEITITLAGPQQGADFDLYLKWDVPPAGFNYDVASLSPGVVFGLIATSSLNGLYAGIFLAAFCTVAQFSFWGNYLPRVYPVHLRGTGESFAANIGGRLIGTSFAWVTATLAVTPDRPYAPTKVALVAAGVGISVYLVGFIASFFLPEPPREELPE